MPYDPLSVYSPMPGDAISVDSLSERNNKFNQSSVDLQMAFQRQMMREQNAFNSAEAQKARDWSERMSNTSHQREVSDLIDAGLNPVLSANGGAAAYSNSAASASGIPSGAAATADNSSVSAVASILKTVLDNQVAMKNAETSAEAVRSSAEISADASRYASDQSAQVTREGYNSAQTVARIGAAASNYASDVAARGNQLSYEAAMAQIDKTFEGAAIDYVKNLAKDDPSVPGVLLNLVDSLFPGLRKKTVEEVKSAWQTLKHLSAQDHVITAGTEKK